MPIDPGTLIPCLLLMLFSGYALLSWKSASRDKAIASKISGLIVSYFDHTALEVRAFAFRQSRNADFILLIETPPISRFRHSNILEGNLIEYVEKITGKTVAKIFWRFSLNQNLARADSIAGYHDDKNQESATIPASTEIALTDELGYPYIDPSAYEIREIGWDEFKTYKPVREQLELLTQEIDELHAKVA